MKKLVNFLSLPIVNLIIGLILYLWIGCGIWNLGDSFDSVSAFYGGCVVVALSIFDYGLSGLFKKNNPV